MPSAIRARYEASLARAHRAMWAAENAADELNSPGEAYDCHMICHEITRLAEDSLRGKARKQLAGQMRLAEPD